MEIATWIAKKAGFDGIQALPVRGVRAGMRLSLPILSAEGPWNATTFQRHLNGLPGEAGGPTKWQDVILFPDPWGCDQNLNQLAFNRQSVGFQRIRHSFDWNFPFKQVVEIHKGMGLTLEQILNLVSKGRLTLVLDTAHCRQPEVLRELGTTYQIIESLLPSISMVHLQGLNKGEWQNLLAHGTGFLSSVLRELKRKGYQGPIVLEFNPFWFGPGYLINPVPTLRRLREAVQREAGRLVA